MERCEKDRERERGKKAMCELICLHCQQTMSEMFIGYLFSLFHSFVILFCIPCPCSKHRYAFLCNRMRGRYYYYIHKPSALNIFLLLLFRRPSCCCPCRFSAFCYERSAYFLSLSRGMFIFNVQILQFIVTTLPMTSFRLSDIAASNGKKS